MTKYIGPKTDGENVATQADKLSLSSETPDVLTPDQTGAAGTATTAARSDHQHEILAGTAGTILPDDAAAEGASTSFARADHTHAIAAASAGTITGTNAEGTSTSFARADHNHAYGALSIPNSALALGPTYETSLPGSPVDGQEVYYAADATNGVIWHLRYRSGASGSYKWEFLGGPSLYMESSAASGFVNSWTALTGTVTAPLAGDYEASYGAFAYGTSSTKRDFFLQAAVATPSVTKPDQIIIGKADSVGTAPYVSRTNKITGASASATIQIYGRNDSLNNTTETEQRFLEVRPIRVG